MTTDQTISEKLKKNLNKIIRNKNLSDETKLELCMELYNKSRKESVFIKQQQLPPENKLLLAGGNPIYNAPLQPQNITSSPQIQHCDNDNNLFDDSDDSTSPLEPTTNSAIHAKPTEKKQKSPNQNDLHRQNDKKSTKEDTNVSKTNEAANSRISTPVTKQKQSLLASHNTYLHNTAHTVISKCKLHKIPLTSKEKMALQTVAKALNTYFKYPLKNKVQSSDKQCISMLDGVIWYKMETKQHRFLLTKLFATFSLKRPHLYDFLNIRDSVKPYTNTEKEFLKFISHSARIPIRIVPCPKIRLLCKN